MAEGARLESVYTATYRGFESPPHRHIRDESLYASTGSFLLYSPQGGMRTPDRGSTTGNASWTDRARSKRAAPQGRAKRVNPPHRHILRRARTQVRAFFFVCGTHRGMRTPTGVRQLATPVGQTASLRAGCPDKNAGSVFEQRLRWPRRGEAQGWAE